MSVRAMNWVWEDSQTKGNDRLVLLAIADHAGDDGANAFPGLKHLAKKTGLARSTVQEAIKRLISTGELSVEKERRGRSFVNVFTVNFKDRISVHDPDSSTDPRHSRTDPRHSRTDQNAPTSENGSQPSRTVINHPPYPPEGGGEEEGDKSLLSKLLGDYSEDAARYAVGELEAQRKRGNPIGNPSAWVRRVAENYRPEFAAEVAPESNDGRLPESTPERQAELNRLVGLDKAGNPIEAKAEVAA